MAGGNPFVDREGRPKHDLRRTKQRVESGRAKDGWGDEVRNHLFNDFQYAQAATIAVKLIYGSGRLSLKIRDNGKVPAVDDHPLLREVRRALLLSASTTIALSGLPAVAQRAVDVDTTLQEVTVTGSYIPRTDSETPSTVEIMTGADIANGGLTSVADVVRTISADNSGTLPTAFPGAFAAGASGVALRGLTVGDTLVLVDGKRMVDYPISDDNQRSFVDVSAIPFNAIERVEVLKDGASAVYGADAIAGVVTIILKKNYTGTEFTA